MFDPYTGVALDGAPHGRAPHGGAPHDRAPHDGGADPARSRAAQLGLEPPRFCAQCGRRMIVQIAPDGWWARCSRHGTIDSALNEQR